MNRSKPFTVLGKNLKIQAVKHVTGHHGAGFGCTWKPRVSVELFWHQQNFLRLSQGSSRTLIANICQQLHL